MNKCYNYFNFGSIGNIVYEDLFVSVINLIGFVEDILINFYFVDVILLK